MAVDTTYSSQLGGIQIEDQPRAQERSAWTRRATPSSAAP
jgi:hypothetical protein